MRQAIARLYAEGVAPDWRAVAGHKPDALPALVDLPTYPFQRQVFRVDHGASAAKADASAVQSAAGRRPGARRAVTEHLLDTNRFPFLADHQVYGRVVAPGSFHVALVLSELSVAPSWGRGPAGGGNALAD